MQNLTYNPSNCWKQLEKFKENVSYEIISWDLIVVSWLSQKTNYGAWGQVLFPCTWSLYSAWMLGVLGGGTWSINIMKITSLGFPFNTSIMPVQCMA